MKVLPLALGIAIACSAGVAAAQNAAPATNQGGIQPAAFSPPAADWKYDVLYERGVSFRNFTDDAELVGAAGNDIGDIEDVLVGLDGKLKAILADVGGVFGLGATRVAIPMAQVRMPSKERIEVPITEAQANDLPLAGTLGLDEMNRGPVRMADNPAYTGLWKLSDFLDQDAFFADRTRYGDIYDFILAPDQGEILAVVVDRGGYYAYPFAGLDIATATYVVPYTTAETAGMTTFDYDLLD